MSENIFILLPHLIDSLSGIFDAHHCPSFEQNGGWISPTYVAWFFFAPTSLFLQCNALRGDEGQKGKSFMHGGCYSNFSYCATKAPYERRVCFHSQFEVTCIMRVLGAGGSWSLWICIKEAVHTSALHLPLNSVQVASPCNAPLMFRVLLKYLQRFVSPLILLTWHFSLCVLLIW